MRERLPFAAAALWLLVQKPCPAESRDPCAFIVDLDAARATRVLEEDEKFKNLGFGGGYGIVADFGGRSRVKEAEVIGNLVRVTKDEDVRFGPMLELHKFMWPLKEKTVEKFSDQVYRLVPKENCSRPATFTDTVPAKEPIALIAFGPFIGLRLGTENVVESFGVGVMFGFRKFDKDTSLNVGFAVMTDPNARTLGDGIEEGKPLPTGETEIRFKTGHQEGWSLLFSVGW